MRNCPRCKQADAGFLHMTWSCDIICAYWEGILDKIKEELVRVLAPTIEACLLGLFPRPIKQKVGNRLIDLALSLAKCRIALEWKSFSGPQVAS